MLVRVDGHQSQFDQPRAGGEDAAIWNRAVEKILADSSKM